MNVAPTSDEKVMAALSHGSIFLAFLGPVVPIAIWTSQRKKSRHVSFHALQAMGYQAFMFWLGIVLMILFIGLIMCLAVPLSIFLMEDPDLVGIFPFIIQIFVFLVIVGWMGLFFLTGMIGAVSCLLGHDFRYPIMGTWLERYLSYSPDLESQLDETQADHWVAGICHATAILQLWGLVTPLIVWFTQKERSARLRFQSMQAFIYQLAAFVAYAIGMALYTLSFFGVFFMLFIAGTMGENGEMPALVGVSVLILFAVIMTIFGLGSTIVAPIYYLLAGFASLRVIQGRPFHYPILGPILEKRMQTSRTPESIS